MLPGKTYKPEDVFQIVRKRFWLIAVPWGIVAAGTAVYGRMLPNMYRAQALVQYVPPRVPETIMRPTTGADLQDRLKSTEATILSRTRLEQLVREFNLYAEERKTRIIEDVVTNMRTNYIRTQPQKGNIFAVQFIGRDPLTVMKVTDKLAGYFIEESLKDGQRRADGTATFVEGEVEEYERKIRDIEDQLRKYKMAYSGELPEQRVANVSTVTGLQGQLQTLGLAVQSDKNRLLFLEKEIAALETQQEAAVTTTGPVAVADPNSIVGNAQQKLNQAKAGLEQQKVLGRRPSHPEYQRWQKAVSTYEKEVNEAALKAPVGTAVVAVSPAEQNRLKQLAAYRNELETLKGQIAQKESQERDIRERIPQYQAKVDRAPIHEAQLQEIQREYEVLKGVYQSFLSKREQANMTVSLQRRQIGEQFVSLDQASLPQSPFSPNRLLINLGGLVGGLVIGLALVAFLEYRDTTFKTDSELGLLSLPVLAVVPLMLSDAERRARFRRQLLLNFGLGGVVAACFAVVAYTFVTMR